MSEESLAGLATGISLIAAGVGVLLWLRAWLRDPGRPTTPDWTGAELAELATEPIPATGRHRLIADRATGQIATGRHHIPKHDEDLVPPSISHVLTRPVAERAHLLAWTLGQINWRPPANPWVPPRTRLLRLALARRLKQAGQCDGLAAPLRHPRRGVLPA